MYSLNVLYLFRIYEIIFGRGSAVSERLQNAALNHFSFTFFNFMWEGGFGKGTIIQNKIKISSLSFTI
jgi:hypothetical protein